MTERRAVAGLALVAVALWALVPTFPNYDTYYHLVWGREIAAGELPGFEAYQAPTQHPLYLALTTLLSLFGGFADRLIVLVAVLAHVAFTWAVFRLGRAAFGPAAGLLAALFAGTSFALLLYAARAYVDIPFLALVLWAAALEAEAPPVECREVAARQPLLDIRRRRAVPWLLAAAGLLRPEAWVLAGLYALWRPGLRTFALAAAAPVTWAVVDLVVTGDPLYSLHATSDLADELGRPQGLGEALTSFFEFLGGTAREPVAVLGALGAALAWPLRRERPLAVLLGLFAAGAFTFAATGVAGLSVLPRYLTVPAVVLCVFAGHAVDRAWAWERRAVIAAVLIALPFAGWFAVDRLDRLTTELDFTADLHDDLDAILRAPAVERGRACGLVTLPNYRLVPDTRWLLDASQDEVGSRSALERERGVALSFTGDKPVRRYGRADGTSPRKNTPPPQFRPVARVGPIVASVAC